MSLRAGSPLPDLAAARTAADIAGAGAAAGRPCHRFPAAARARRVSGQAADRPVLAETADDARVKRGPVQPGRAGSGGHRAIDDLPDTQVSVAQRVVPAEAMAP